MTLSWWCCRRPPAVLFGFSIGEVTRILCYPATSMFWFLWCRNVSRILHYPATSAFWFLWCSIALFFISVCLPFTNLTKIMRQRLEFWVVSLFVVKSQSWGWEFTTPLASLQKVRNYTPQLILQKHKTFKGKWKLERRGCRGRGGGVAI